ncbi:MAG: hypothetical protein O7D94_01545 [Planctomycetota bacterium]|nr:hypothetical protein [Planctomycetota bacterium]
MSEIDRPDDPGEYHLSDPAETASPDVIRYAQASGATPFDVSRGDHGPVPASPLHLCPSCEYELRGLLSRRCPECGTAFTLADARQKGTEKSAEARQDRRVILTARLQFALGVILLSSGFIGAFRFGTSDPLMRWVLSVLVFTILGLVLLYKMFYPMTWSMALFVAGALTFVLSAVIVWV